MPWAAPTPCRQPGCPAYAQRQGWCPTHDPGPFAGTGPMPPGWDKTRAAILTRDGHRCVYCGQPAVAVNHRTPRAWGGTDEPGNLESVCQKCHDHLTARAAAARRVRR